MTMEPLVSLPARPPTAIDSFGVAFGFVHARIHVSHPRSPYSPYARLQGEGTYISAENVKRDVRRVVAYVYTRT